MASNPVLILTHNCVELTKECVASVRNQDVQTEILIWDNASNDGTTEWMREVIVNGGTSPIPNISGHFSCENRGVSAGWNWGINYFLKGFSHVLVLNNDLILPRNFYSQLLSCNVPFVSGSETTNLADLSKEWPALPLGGGPQFSAFLIRRDAWEAIGPFDERMWGWASDCDYHLRAHRLGIPLQCSPVRYYHERSSTIKTASPRERRLLELQADADREVFNEIYGFYPSDPGYADLFKEVPK